MPFSRARNDTGTVVSKVIKSVGDEPIEPLVRCPIPDIYLVKKSRAGKPWRAICGDEEWNLGGIEVGPHTISSNAHMLRTSAREIPLTPMEYCVLKHLAAHRNAVVPYRELVNSLWGTYSGRGTHSLRCFVSSIRRKIEVDPARPSYIVTVPRIGYSLQS
jgi:DNA-binding response OmpR family regulator